MLLVLIASVNATAQPSADVNIGPVLSSSKNASIQQILGNYGDNFVALRGGKSSKSIYSIDGYDKNGFLKYSTPVSFDFKGQRFWFKAIVGLKNNILLFASKYDKDKDLNVLIASILSPDGKVVRDFQVMDEISSSKKHNSGEFNIQITDDSSKVLVYRNEPYDKKGMEKVHFTLLDENLNKLWSKPFELPIKDKESQLKDYAVDNEGRVFIVSKKRETTATADSPIVYVVYGYLPENDKFVDFELALPDKYLTDPSILFDRSGELLISGFYKTDWRKGVTGLFYMRVDPNTLSVIASNFKDFGKELLIEFLGEKQGEKADRKDKGLYSYVLRQVVRRTDGGLVLIAEQSYMYIVCTTDDKGRTRCNYHYVYGDLLVANINSLGAVDWYARIPKRQHTVNDDGFYSSFILAVRGDKLSFVFNDHPKNFTETNNDKLHEIRVMKKSLVALYEVNGSGQVSRSPLITNKGQQVILRPKISTQNSPSSLTALGVRGKKFNFVRIEFGD